MNYPNMEKAEGGRLNAPWTPRHASFEMETLACIPWLLC